MGDFNDMLDPTEKEGRVPHPLWCIEGFRDAVRFCVLEDIPSAGYRFTWERGRGSANFVREKVDRVMVNAEWMSCFQTAGARVVEGTNSDHMAVCMHASLERDQRSGRVHRFRFENSWLREEECRAVMERSWRVSEGRDIHERLKVCGRALWKWGRGFYGNFRRRLDRCRTELERLRRGGGVSGSFEDIQKEYMRVLECQDCFWRQRAKHFWLEGGDLNTKFYHNSAKERKRKNVIRGLYDRDGMWVSEVRGLGSIIVSYFKQLFSFVQGDKEEVLRCVTKRVTDEQNMALTAEVKRDEVWVVVFDMFPDKSPGPDGMSPGFYKAF